MATTKNLSEVIRRELASDPKLAAAVEAERFNADVGSAILEARTRAGLTQKELADRVGMHQSAIARLEDADYDGHSLKTLQRIAAALGKRVKVAFVGQGVNVQAVHSKQFTLKVSGWEEGRPEWNPTVTTRGPGIQSGNREAVG